MSDPTDTGNRSLSYRAKTVLVKTLLLAFATAFETLSKSCPELKAELADWEEGRVFSLGVLPNGPYISIRKEGDRVRYLGMGLYHPTLTALFKNLDAILLPFTGQIGSHTAFIQHRAILHGNVGQAMQANRAMNIVQTYLLPGFMLKKMFKRPPKLSPAQMVLKARVMALLVAGIVKNMRK